MESGGHRAVCGVRSACVIFVCGPALYVSVSLAMCVGLRRFGEAWALALAPTGGIFTYLLFVCGRTHAHTPAPARVGIPNGFARVEYENTTMPSEPNASCD